MQLNRMTERIWVYPFEEERDRPNLSYIRGDRWSLAVPFFVVTRTTPLAA